MRIAAWVVAAVSALFLLLAAVCGILNWSLGGRPMPQRVNNRQALFSAQPPPVRVAVLGDSQKGLANMARLLEAVKREGVSLILHTGDLVSTNDEGHYRLAALYLGRAGLDAPMAVVPGNHDVKGGTERFLREFGATEFSCTQGSVRFVALDNALGDPPDLRRLEAEIKGDSEVVLLMHVPPFDVKGNILPAYQPFVDWLSKSRVRYLFCGQLHDYIRKRIGNTIVIANGVGGDYESWQLKQKVYATILEVDQGRLSDRTIELPPEHGFVENLEHLAIGHVAEAYRSHPVATWAGTALLAALAAAAVRVARLPR